MEIRVLLYQGQFDFKDSYAGNIARICELNSAPKNIFLLYKDTWRVCSKLCLPNKYNGQKYRAFCPNGQTNLMLLSR